MDFFVFPGIGSGGIVGKTQRITIKKCDSTLDKPLPGLVSRKAESVYEEITHFYWFAKTGDVSNSS